MAATFGAATRATFTAIVFVFELTRDYDAILPLMLATVLADLVARRDAPRQPHDREARPPRVSVPGDYAPDVHGHDPGARDHDHRGADHAGDATVRDASPASSTGRHSAYPLVDDDGRCVGIVSRSDLLAAGRGRTTNGRRAGSDVVTVAPDDTARRAAAILDEEVDHLPVLDDDRLVGMCTRTDVLRARHAARRRSPPTRLAGSPALRRGLGGAGRRSVRRGADGHGAGSPSTCSMVPSATAVMPGTLRTAGMPSSWAMIAAWLWIAPVSTPPRRR